MSNYTVEQIQLINKTTTGFYSSVAESFSETRQHEWDGWKRILPYFKNGDSVLDLGCGNCRFSKFLIDNNLKVEVDNYDNFDFPGVRARFTPSNFSISPGSTFDFYKKDIIEALLNNNLNLKVYDVAVCFGVLHHIPSYKLREALLRELTKSKVAIVSFWQFEKDERIFKKAQETTKIAQQKLNIQNLENNDFFLGWKDREDVLRYCHNFSDEEITSIKNNFNVVEEFCSDGSKLLNRYLIFKS